MYKFTDRVEAGKILAHQLKQNSTDYDIVLALPRGGVPVAAEIAHELHLPFNVFVARKLGAPNNPEFGIGAIAEPNAIVLDEQMIERLSISKEELNKIIDDQKLEMKRRVDMYREGFPLPDLKVRKYY